MSRRSLVGISGRSSLGETLELNLLMRTAELDWTEGGVDEGRVFLAISQYDNLTMGELDDPSRSELASVAVDGKVWTSLLIVQGEDPDVAPTCDAEVFAQPIIAAVRESAESRSESPSDVLVAALTDASGERFDELTSIALGEPDGEDIAWDAQPVDERVISSEPSADTPEEVLDSLTQATVLVSFPEEWTDFPYSVCAHVPGIGWNDSCYLLSSGVSPGLIAMHVLVSSTGELTLALNEAGDGVQSPIGTIATIEVPAPNAAGVSGPVVLVAEQGLSAEGLRSAVVGGAITAGVR